MDEGSSHIDAETVIEANSVVKKFGKLVAIESQPLIFIFPPKVGQRNTVA